MDQLRHKLRAARSFRIAHRVVRIENRGAVRIGIEIRILVRPIPLADDKMLPVAGMMPSNSWKLTTIALHCSISKTGGKTSCYVDCDYKTSDRPADVKRSLEYAKTVLG